MRLRGKQHGRMPHPISSLYFNVGRPAKTNRKKDPAFLADRTMDMQQEGERETQKSGLQS